MTTGWLLNRMAKGLLMTGEQELKDNYYENYIIVKRTMLIELNENVTCEFC